MSTKAKYQPKTPDHRGWDREGRTEALIQAAIEVFAECGFDAATTRAIAVRAGCSEGLISRYFKTKEGLLEAAFQCHALKGRSETIDALPDGLTLKEELQWMFEQAMEKMWKARDFLRVGIGRSIVDDRFAANLGAALGGIGLEKIRQRLAWHQKAGRIAAGQNLEEATEAISAFVFALGFNKQIVLREDRAKIKAMAASSASILARGLATSDLARSDDEAHC